MTKKNKKGLPIYELSMALEGRVDEFDDPIPDVTHVEFLRDYMTAGDFQVILQIIGDRDVTEALEDQGVLMGVVMALLPRMTTLTAEEASMIHARDFMSLVEVVSPFLSL